MRNLEYPVALCFAVLSVHAAVPPGATWTNVSSGLSGSPPGLTSLLINPSTGSTLYAVTSDNSIFKVFKSTDGGANWKALGKIAEVNTLALDPTSSSTVYAGTGRGVFKSTDGGNSWASTGLSGISISVLTIDPITPSNLYAGGASVDTVYRSMDAGASWTAVSIGPPLGSLTGIRSLTFDPGAPSTLYVVANGSPDSYGLYKSTDGGQTWSVVSSGLVRLLAIASTTPSTLYATRNANTGGAGLSKSTDGAATWTQTGFTQNVDVSALAIDPANPNTMYAAAGINPHGGTPPAIFKSADGGQNWDSGNTTIPLAQSLVLSPADSSTIYAGTAGGVFKSTDRGANWGAANTGLNVFDIETLVGDPINPATIYAGGNNGLFKSVNSGESWSQVAAFQLTCCGYVPGYPPGVLPPNYGQVYPAAVTSLLIDFANPNILYAGTYGGNCELLGSNLHKSTDGGATWNDSSTDCADGPLMAMDPTDPNTLYLRWGDDYDGYRLRKSTDGGVTWGFNDQAHGAAVWVLFNGLSALGIDPTTPASLYAATASTSPEGSSVIGGVQKSTDGGATWNVIGLANQDASLLVIDPVQPNIIYAGLSDYAAGCCFRGLFKSGDGGASWSPINNGLGDLLGASVNVNALLLDPDHPDVLYLGTSGYGVLKSSDGGASWAAFNDGLTFLDVRSLAIVRGASPAVYAGTPGGVFKIVDPRKLAPIRHREHDANKY